MAFVTVVETPEFESRARGIMSDDGRMGLIDYVARNPMAGVSIGAGIRKFRWARPGSGKSGGYRVIHFYSAADDSPVVLITVFGKNEKANLSRHETEAVKTLGRRLAETYRKRQ
jgi:hypothetical protein